MIDREQAGSEAVRGVDRPMDRRITNIVLAGVGGQGSVLATRIIATAAGLAGHEVVTSEVHGMSQRGGTVTTTVRYGAEVLSSAIPDGEADFLVAFEWLEAARHLPMVKRGGIMIASDQRIAPSIEALKHADFPADLQERADARGVTTHLYPALRLARELGNEKLSNTVLLGALSDFLFVDRRHWMEAIRRAVPPKTIEANEAAFDTGSEWLVGPAVFSF